METLLVVGRSGGEVERRGDNPPLFSLSLQDDPQTLPDQLILTDLTMNEGHTVYIPITISYSMSNLLMFL